VATVSAGLVLLVAGAWVLAQVLKGNALGRLGISGEPNEVRDPRGGIGAKAGA
jgi:hypothetical protein